MVSNACIFSLLPIELRLKILNNLSYEDIRKLLLVLKDDEAVLQKLHHDVLIHITLGETLGMRPRHTPPLGDDDDTFDGYHKNTPLDFREQAVGPLFNIRSSSDIGRYYMTSSGNTYNSLIRNVKNLTIVCDDLQRESAGLDYLKRLIYAGSSQIFQELESLRVITSYIDHDLIEFFNNFSVFQNLKVLQFNSSFEGDQIPPISLPNLIDLNIYTDQLSLGNHFNLPALNKLVIEKARIAEIKGLDSLIKLETLKMGFNDISKLENLDQLVNLRYLDISNNQIKKFEGLQRLQNLESLQLSHNQITEIDGLVKLQSLKFLDLSFNSLQELPQDFLYLRSLKVLILDGNFITSLEHLENLDNLEFCSLRSNKIESLIGIPNSKYLRHIDASDNRIETLEFTADLRALEMAILDNCNIQRLGNINGLSNAKQLILRNNNVVEMRPFDTIRNLETLVLDNNKITKLEPLFNLSKLRTLSMQDNLVEKLENLSFYRNLRKLNLLNNRISKIENLNQSTQLRELQLSLRPQNNQISKFENLQHLPRLETLVLDAKTAVKVENLSQLLNLESLTLYTGVLQSIDHSFQYLLRDNSLNNLNIQEHRLNESKDHRAPKYIAIGGPFLVHGLKDNTLQTKIQLWHQLKNAIEQR